MISRCASCGFENPAGLKFCIGCGVPLPAYCLQCGFAHAPQAKFCGACSTALTDHRSAPRLVPQEPQAAPDQGRAPLTYTPPYLTEKILTSRSALAGERKQVTVLFGDIKDSTELIKNLDPEAAGVPTGLTPLASWRPGRCWKILGHRGLRKKCDR